MYKGLGKQMACFPVFYESDCGLSAETALEAIKSYVKTRLDASVRRVLLVPPDHTRSHSYAGWLTRCLYTALPPAVHCDILPALGSHRFMSRDELALFFGSEIPPERFIGHDWRNDTVSMGWVPAEVMSDLSGGQMREAVPVEVSRHVVNGGYDRVVSLGQVVPHEVAGMANYAKNLLVGCGGARMIDASHLLSVYAGTEKWIGRDHSPVRRLFDYAQSYYLDRLPLDYLLTVTTSQGEATVLNGLYIGGGRAAFEKAVALSRRLNVFHTKKPVDTCVVRLPAEEFRSAWLSNKSVYRTRKALAKGGSLVILAPGFERFGEDDENDRIIRQYGYTGRERLLKLLETEVPLQSHRSALAHLVQGSADGLFQIRYCTSPAYAEEIRAVGYAWGDVDEYTSRYAGLREGWNQTENGEVYWIDNPALGLWEV